MADQIDFFKQLLTSSKDSRSLYEEYDQSVVIIINYVSSRNLRSAIEEVKLLAECKARMQKFIDIALCMLIVNDYSNKLTVPTAVGELVAQLISEGVLKSSPVYSRFHQFFKRREHFETKYKDFMETVTEFLAWLLISLRKYLKKHVLCKLLQPFKRGGMAQKLMALVMKRLSELRSPSFAKALWASAGFEWGDFLQKAGNEAIFIEKNGLEFLNPATGDINKVEVRKLEEFSVRPKVGPTVKPELQIQKDTSTRTKHPRLRGYFVDEPSMKWIFRSLLLAYLEDRDMEKFRFQMEPLIKRTKSVDSFARYAIETGIELGMEFCKPIGELLSYLMAFGLVTEKQRFEALKVVPQSVVGKGEINFVDKDTIKKLITSFMVNSEVKATALWASTSMKQYHIFNEASFLCQAAQSDSIAVQGAKGSPSLVPFLPSQMAAKIHGETRDHTEDRKGVGILLDYLTDNDIHEAIKDFQTCYDQSNSAQFVSTAVNHAIDDKVSRNALGKLLVHFVAHNIIKPEQFRKGWLKTFCCAIDSNQDASDFLDLLNIMLENCNCNDPGSQIFIDEIKELSADVQDYLVLEESNDVSNLQ